MSTVRPTLAHLRPTQLRGPCAMARASFFSLSSETHLRDHMRGEEVQIVGFGLDNDGIVVLAGTRSKWAKVEGGRIFHARAAK